MSIAEYFTETFKMVIGVGIGFIFGLIVLGIIVYMIDLMGEMFFGDNRR